MVLSDVRECYGGCKMAFSMREKDVSTGVVCFDVYFCPMQAHALDTRKASWSLVLRISLAHPQGAVPNSAFPHMGLQNGGSATTAAANPECRNLENTYLTLPSSLAQSISAPAVKVVTMVCAKCQKLKSTSLATPAVKKKNEMYYGSPAGSAGRVEKSSATNGSAAAGKVCWGMMSNPTLR